jgi:catechol 2,3-dioxygenase-like lactoylglutathione lyase family enzyme
MAQVLGSKKLVQIGLIVRDIEKTSTAYAEVFGVEVPQWILTDPEDTAHTRYRGQRTEARAKLAFLDMGSVTIELIEPVGGPSTWQDFLEVHGEGVHHIAFVVNGMPEQVSFLESKGVSLVQSGEYTGGRYAYMDGQEQLKVILELLEND